MRLRGGKEIAKNDGHRRRSRGTANREVDGVQGPGANGHAEHTYDVEAHGKEKSKPLREELWNMALLVVLYMMQGVPLGLTMGSMPFLLQSVSSYTQLGLFSIASYPYSFKLLWSPVVDSVYSAAFGRRKSWVVPMQLASASLMLGAAGWLEARLKEADIVAITALFFVAVLLAATQDIAVDGWALTLLSRQHVGWASTCQTVGMNLGYFGSFTLFLALNDATFCNAWLRAEPAEEGLLSLAAYLRFWGWVYVAVTLAIALLKAESPADAAPGAGAGAAPERGGGVEEGEPALELAEAYGVLGRVAALPAVRRLALVLVTCRLGMLPAEQAAPMKLLEKGVSKEAIAGLVLIDFPCQLLSALLAGRWAAGGAASAPWLTGYYVRLAAAAAVTALVAAFPQGAASPASHPQLFTALAALGLATSFASTLMFTALGSFYTRISDPAIGGAYLTLLNTIANMGITLPKLGLFWCMDLLTARRCVGGGGGACAGGAASECVAAGGSCEIVTDGFYALSYAAVAIGALLSLYFLRELPRLEQLPQSAWRAGPAVAKKLQ